MVERKLRRRKGKSEQRAEIKEPGWKILAADDIERADGIANSKIRTELRILDTSNVCSADPVSPEFRLLPCP